MHKYVLFWLLNVEILDCVLNNYNKGCNCSIYVTKFSNSFPNSETPGFHRLKRIKYYNRKMIIIPNLQAVDPGRINFLLHGALEDFLVKPNKNLS